MKVRTFADLSKSQKILKFSPRISFDEGISLFLDWHKNYKN